MVLLVLTVIYAASGPVINLLRQFKEKVIYADKKRDSYEK